MRTEHLKSEEKLKHWIYPKCFNKTLTVVFLSVNWIVNYAKSSIYNFSSEKLFIDYFFRSLSLVINWHQRYWNEPKKKCVICNKIFFFCQLFALVPKFICFTLLVNWFHEHTPLEIGFNFPESQNVKRTRRKEMNFLRFRRNFFHRKLTIKINWKCVNATLPC